MPDPGTERARAIEDHLPLVRAIARRFAGQGESLDDLVQVGTIGLIKAVDGFDPTRERDLAALARPSIEGEIRHHLRDRVPGVHVPRPERELATRLRATADELAARRRRRPTLAEVAEAAGVGEQQAAAALGANAATRTSSLDESAPPANGPVVDETEAAEARALLAAGWDVLDERERRMLRLRFHEDRSQAEIARELGLSQAHVSRLLRAATERLRRELDGEGPAPAPTPPTEPSRPRRSGRILLRLPPALHADLARAAEEEHLSLNAYIATTLATSLGRTPPPPDPHERRRARLLVVNAVVIAVAALSGIALLLVALLG